MTYITINYSWIWEHAFLRIGVPLGMYIYNHNLIHYNHQYSMLKWFLPLVMLTQFEACYKYYRTQLTKAMLFDEYVQARADELVAQREHLIRSDKSKKYIEWNHELNVVLAGVKRDSVNNHASDFKTSELELQAFIRKWVDPAKGIQFPNAGPKYGFIPSGFS